MSKEKKQVKESDPAAELLKAKIAEFNNQLQETSNQLEMLTSRREQLKGAIFALQSTVSELAKDAAAKKDDELLEKAVEKSSNETGKEVKANG